MLKDEVKKLKDKVSGIVQEHPMAAGAVLTIVTLIALNVLFG